MTSPARALAASSLLLCAIACAAITLLTFASSATEELAQSVPVASSSMSALEARVKADAQHAAVKDAGVKAMQAELIKYKQAEPFPHAQFVTIYGRYAQATQPHASDKAALAEQNQHVVRANAVQESLTKIAAEHPHANVDVSSFLVSKVKADDAKVPGCMRRCCV
jgi:hypothetical protein